MNSMKTRRTIRAYSDRNLDDQLLEELMNIACRASNTGNMQAYSVVVTRDPERKRLLAPLHFNQQQILTAPVVLTFCADFNRFSKWCEQRKAEPGYANFQALAYAAIDTVILAQAFCDAAEASGLGICYLGTTTYNAEQIAEALALPQLVLPITTISVGYPKGPVAGPMADRLPLKGLLHQETYRDYTEADIDRIYAEKEALDENRNFIEINKKETLAQIFTDIRYTKKDNEYFSEAFLKAIRKQGFKL
jgi:Nitroreductase